MARSESCVSMILPMKLVIVILVIGLVPLVWLLSKLLRMTRQ